jgi:hypothetical protein
VSQVTCGRCEQSLSSSDGSVPAHSRPLNVPDWYGMHETGSRVVCAGNGDTEQDGSGG